MTIRVVYMGTPAFAVPALEALHADPRVQVTLVVSQPNRVSGRGQKVQLTPVAAAAQALDLPTFQPQTLRDPDAVERLRQENADLFVVAAYGQILREEVLQLPKHGCVNLHGSLLPRWRGAAPIQWAVAEGDAVTGVALMRMERGLDTGPVYAMHATMIAETETAGELHDRLAAISAPLLLDNLERLVDPNVHPEPQNNDRTTYARMLSVDDRRLDLSCDAQHLAWQINGMSPWPSTKLFFGSEALTLHRARRSALTAPADTAPGTVVAASSKDGLHIACGQGSVLELLEAQRPGKKSMTAAILLAGYSIEIGSLASADGP